VTFSSGLRLRVLLILLAVVAAAAAGLMVLRRAQDASSQATSVTTSPVTTKTATAKTGTATATTKAATPSATTPVRPTPKPVVPPARPRAAVAQPNPDKLPAAIQSALSANRAVVIALYDPRAKIDDTALREARAGAELAGTTFVAIDVRKNQVAPLNARYGVIQDPAVLVLRPPGDLVVRIDGFADRDTVAQAAANAAT
jgi:hypothetical protein